MHQVACNTATKAAGFPRLHLKVFGMPYRLTRHSPNSATIELWVHNALNPRGFVMVIGMASATLAMPLIAVLGSPVLWGLMPFAGIVLCGLWFGLDRNWRDRQITERMEMSRQAITLTRVNPRGPVQEWRADPHWVATQLSAKTGPVAQYLTLTGGGREVELGSFLTPEERIALHAELNQVLVSIKTYQV